MSASPPPAVTPPPPTRQHRFFRWHRRLLAFCFVVFAFELGLFLLIFPWLRQWEMNWVLAHSPRLVDFWMSRYFRGAISGLGLLNLYIAFAEAAKQLKALFAPPEA
jgi:hypothetical protein